MKTRFITLLALGGLLLWSAAPAGAQSTSDRSDVTQSNTGPGQFSGSQSTASRTDLPKQYFQAARTAFNNRDYTASAQNLRQGADILRKNAANVHGELSDNLNDTATGLDKLAERVQRGEVNSIDKLNDKIGDAYKYLANYHYKMAKESYQRNRAANMPPGRDVETGNALNAAADDLENWSEVTGHALKSGAQNTVSVTRDLAGKMISGTGWAFEQAGSAIDDFGNAIRDFGHDVGHSVLHPFRAHEERVRTQQQESTPPPPPVPAPGPQY